MKKIVFCIIVFLMFSIAAIGQEENRYYFGSISSDFYDIKTFKYNSLKNKYSIDIFHEVNDRIKSPYDENDIIYLIFATNYYPKNNKLKIKYKGFLSAAIVNDDKMQSKFKLENIKIYNKTPYIAELNDYVEDLKRWLSRGNKLTFERYIKDVTQDIHSAYIKNSLNDLKYFKGLEEF